MFRNAHFGEILGVNPNKQTIQHKKTKHKTTTGNQTSASFKQTQQDKKFLMLSAKETYTLPLSNKPLVSIQDEGMVQLPQQERLSLVFIEASQIYNRS